MREQRLHATLGIALLHEAEVVGPFGVSSGVDSETKSLAARVRDDQIDATTCVRMSLPGLLSRQARLAEQDPDALPCRALGRVYRPLPGSLDPQYYSACQRLTQVLSTCFLGVPRPLSFLSSQWFVVDLGW
jgi:hypothetical protein